jgi:mercuric ion transport protein
MNKTRVEKSAHYKKSLISAAVGTVIVALCCFTPILVIGVSLLGLGILTPYLDYILLPALVVLYGVTVVSYRKWKQSWR